MQQRIRRFDISIPLAGTLAVADGVAAHIAQCRGRVLDVEFSLNNLGTVGGTTTVQVNLNAATILPAANVSVAQNAITKATRVSPAAPVGHPSGVDFNVGDVFTVDVKAIATGNDSANGFVTLHCAALDV